VKPKRREPRSVSIMIRVSEAEREELNVEARRRGLQTGPWLRALGLELSRASAAPRTP